MDQFDYLIEKYSDLAQVLTEKYTEYKKLQKDDKKTSIEILSIMHNEIHSIESQLSDIRNEIRELRKALH